MLISKMKFCLSDKMPTKKVKIKKPKEMEKLENVFLILTLWGGILPLRQGF
jgi:hypothetical protein